jgi:hypothetical protein
MYRAQMLLGLMLVSGGSVTLRGESRDRCVQVSDLVGTWSLVSAKSGGKRIDFPAGTTILKHVTPTHFVFLHHDREGKLTQAGGGSYTVLGNSYVEMPEYGLGDAFQPLIGRRQSFTVRIADGRWYQSGRESTGDVIEEIWERLPPTRSP